LIGLIVDKSASWGKWKTGMISATPTGGKLAKMVWASIWLDESSQAQRSELVIMERDPDAKRKGYSSQSYIKTLTKELLPRWKHSQHFMQDNARIHTSRAGGGFPCKAPYSGHQMTGLLT
jgi:hypothetical protein